MNRRIISVAAVLAVTATVPALAGEIAGLPPSTPPRIDAPLMISLSNDLLGGKSVDDFRTGQTIISGGFGEYWEFTVDHSILTLINSDDPGRTDELAASFGRRLVDSTTASSINRVSAGLGLRSYGEIYGERLQNGSHRITGSTIEIVPYTGLNRSDATAWVDAQRYSSHLITPESDAWRLGYWLRGAALWASGGQLDASIGAYGVASWRSLDGWIGLRRDWRTGYTEPVLAETARQEHDLAAVFGLRWGPVVFETVQQFDKEASYGELRVIASGFSAGTAGRQAVPLTIGGSVTAPDVTVHVTGRYRAAWLNRTESTWQRSLFATGGYGEPQYADDPTVYRRTIQAGAGVEWQRRLHVRNDWVSAWLALGAGWRREQIFGDADREGEESASVSGAVVLAGTGLQFDGSELVGGYEFGVRLGLDASIPFSRANVDMGGESFDVQRPVLVLSLGLVFGRLAD